MYLHRAQWRRSHGRLMSALKQARALDPETSLDSLLDAVQTHAGNAPQNDDITAVVLAVDAEAQALV